MELISKDILNIIFNMLSSYQRSKICTVCRLWESMALQIMSQTERAESWKGLLSSGYYHRIIRVFTTPDPIVLELYENSLRNGMWTNVRLIELYCKIYGVRLTWDENKVYNTANHGHEKVFYYLWDNQRTNIKNISNQVYVKAERYLGYKLNKPELITLDNVPKTTAKIINHMCGYYIKSAVFGRILELSNIDWWDVLEESMLSFSCLQDKLYVLDTVYDYAYPQLVSIDSYQTLINYCSKCKERQHKVNKKIVDMCKNLTITVGNYRKFGGNLDGDISGYCGIMASGYNEKIVDLVIQEDGDEFMLYAAYKHKHKEMFVFIYERMREGLISRSNL